MLRYREAQARVPGRQLVGVVTDTLAAELKFTITPPHWSYPYTSHSERQLNELLGTLLVHHRSKQKWQPIIGVTVCLTPIFLQSRICSLHEPGKHTHSQCHLRGGGQNGSELCVTASESNSPLPAQLHLCRPRTALLTSPRSWLFEQLDKSFTHLWWWGGGAMDVQHPQAQG